MKASVSTFISLNAAQSEAVVLCAAVDFAADADPAPEWVHLVPAGEIRTGDGRGPYSVENMQQLIAQSLGNGERLVLDENHATDLAAPKGLPAPAAGWIAELQARADGLWGRVEWTADGGKLVAGRAYRGISPALLISKAGKVLKVLRASLVNQPNLKGLVALHQEQTMDLLKKLAAKLGLADGVAEDAVLAALDKQSGTVTALQAQLGAVAKAAGVAENATGEVILNAIGTLAGRGGDASAIVSLQAELTTVTTELNTLKQDGAKSRAETFVDGAIKLGRVGVKPLRDHYVSRHMTDAAAVEKEIGALPVLNGQSVVDPARQPGGKDANGKRVFTPEQQSTITLMQLDPEAYGKTLDAAEAAEALL